MKVTRRNMLLASGGAAVAGAVVSSVAQAATPASSAATSNNSASINATENGYVPVRTLNGWTLPPTLNNGVKEFHLVAEEFDHEFAPGCTAKCWGYNGSTPGPTLEAVEGDRVRIFVTNHLPEHTTIHWHGLLLPSGMDGVAGLTQPAIQPGETYVYEFTLKQSGTFMYHPHADEMVQVATGMMGLFIIHPKTNAASASPRVDRDYAFLLHNWSLHPGTYRPDPSILLDFDLWTFNSKVFPAIDSLVARAGERVRIRIGNLSMWNHPIHLHGHQYQVTGSDGGRWPASQWRTETTEIVGVGQTRDIEFIATEGDWALHCHMSHHTMNAMGHDIPNNLGAQLTQSTAAIKRLLPGYMAMGEKGMAEHQDHSQHMSGPANTLPMMMGKGPHGNLEMGGMFTVLKVRRNQPRNDYTDPGWYEAPANTQARKLDQTAQRPVITRRSTKGTA